MTYTHLVLLYVILYTTIREIEKGNQITKSFTIVFYLIDSLSKTNTQRIYCKKKKENILNPEYLEIFNDLD